MKKVFGFVVISAIMSTAHAEFISGNTLLSYLDDNSVKQELGIGYIIGVTDALMGAVVCPPSSVTAGQIRDLTRAKLIDNPEQRHKSADLFVRAAVEQVWPCKKTTSRSSPNV